MFLFPIGVSPSRSNLFYPSYAWPLALLETPVFVSRSSTSNSSCCLQLHELPRLAVAGYSPYRSGKLVGDGCDRHAVGSALEQLGQTWPLLDAFRPDYRSRPIHQKGPQVRIVALADAQLADTAACAGLSGGQTDPSRELPAVLEGRSRAHRGNHCSGSQHPYARNLRYSLTRRGRTQVLRQTSFDQSDVCLDALHSAQLLSQALDQPPRVRIVVASIEPRNWG
jgi:hypothetical protein